MAAQSEIRGAEGRCLGQSLNCAGIRGMVAPGAEGVGVYRWGRQGVEGRSPDGMGVYGVGEPPAGTGVRGVALNASGYGGFFVNIEGGDLLAANNASTFDDLEFRVNNVGDVYADGGYHCGAAIDDGDDDTLSELELNPCLNDLSWADVAEMLPADSAEPLEAGDVLVLGAAGRLTRSTRPFDPEVVGVYSTRPSYLGNSRFAGAEGWVPLALLGVVPVKASAENGPIRPGDALSAGSTPGHAMRAGVAPPEGAVIGRALELLEEGSGKILMLVQR